MSSTFFIRILAVVAAVFALGLGASATKAKAFSPDQTTVSGVVNTQYWDLDRFWQTNFNAWGWRGYAGPYVRYFNPGPYSNFLTGCGSTAQSAFMNDWGVYCGGGDRAVYLNVNNLQYGINNASYRDGGAAFLFAHEFSHHIQELEGTRRGGRPTELNADCLAGMYFRWGVTQSRILNSTDLAEARYTIYYAFGSDLAGHGSGSTRLAWFDYGYSTYNLAECNRAFSLVTGARAPSTAKKVAKRLGARTTPTTPVVAPAPTGA